MLLLFLNSKPYRKKQGLVFEKVNIVVVCLPSLVLIKILIHTHFKNQLSLTSFYFLCNE